MKFEYYLKTAHMQQFERAEIYQDCEPADFELKDLISRKSAVAAEDIQIIGIGEIFDDMEIFDNL